MFEPGRRSNERTTVILNLDHPFDFCFLYFIRHYIVLIVSTSIKEQYMDWVRLVESKIRFLIHGLEKNSFISLVHINPQGYQEFKEKLVLKILTFFCFTFYEMKINSFFF